LAIKLGLIENLKARSIFSKFSMFQHCLMLERFNILIFIDGKKVFMKLLLRKIAHRFLEGI